MDEEQIAKLLKQIPGARRGADGVIIGDERGSFYVTDIGKADSDLSAEEQLFTPFCAKKEIIRLRSLSSAHDYLLRLRANAIADSARLSRVVLSRRKRFERNGRIWSLSAYYDTLNGPAKRYVDRLARRDRALVRAVPFGFAPLLEANAVCLKSIIGDVVFVSEALRYFYYFMTICLFGSEFGIDRPDCADAGVIALRIMKGSEAQDFDIDPRGTLARSTEAVIQRRVDDMIEFTFGHEFAHLLLDHLSLTGPPIAAVLDADLRTYSHAQEYAADLHAIQAIRKDRAARSALTIAAYNVFLYLHMIDLMSAENSDVPHFSVSDTHPAPLDRLRSLREKLHDRASELEHEMAIEAVHVMKEILLERIRGSARNDLLTMYGSVYLHGLGGKPRQDRIDF
jgi:hypothetical protein